MKFLYVFLAILALAVLPAAVNFIAGSSALTLVTLIVLGYICYRIATSPALAFGTPDTHLAEEPQEVNRQYCRNHLNRVTQRENGYSRNH